MNFDNSGFARALKESFSREPSRREVREARRRERLHPEMPAITAALRRLHGWDGCVLTEDTHPAWNGGYDIPRRVENWDGRIESVPWLRGDRYELMNRDASSAHLVAVFSVPGHGDRCISIRGSIEGRMPNLPDHESGGRP